MHSVTRPRHTLCQEKGDGKQKYFSRGEERGVVHNYSYALPKATLDTHPSFLYNLKSITNWSNGNTYVYPDAFEGILNDVKIYQCAMSRMRVIIANGIPDHTVVQGNPNSPCEIMWAIEVSKKLTEGRIRRSPHQLLG